MSPGTLAIGPLNWAAGIVIVIVNTKVRMIYMYLVKDSTQLTHSAGLQFRILDGCIIRLAPKQHHSTRQHVSLGQNRKHSSQGPE